MVISSVRSVQHKARNSLRMSDIKNINTAINLYITENGHAPLYNNPNFYGFATETLVEWTLLEQELSSYINLPEDPCGEDCFDDSGDEILFYAYSYEASNSINYLENDLCSYYGDLGIAGACSNQYRVYAQNLEDEGPYSSFGFGEGSF